MKAGTIASGGMNCGRMRNGVAVGGSVGGLRGVGAESEAGAADAVFV